MSAIQKQYAAYARDEEHLLTLYAFPQAIHHHIRSTNATPSFFRNVRRRTDHIDTFTTAHQLSVDWMPL